MGIFGMVTALPSGSKGDVDEDENASADEGQPLIQLDVCVAFMIDLLIWVLIKYVTIWPQYPRHLGFRPTITVTA